MPSLMGACTKNDINIARRHAQIQVALVEIGKQLGFRTWVAQNDKGIIYKDRPLKDMETVVSSLKNEKLLIGREEAAENAKLIDCVWFKNGKLMPAVMEIEHSTGVTSGLTRMKNFYDEFIRLEGVRYVIVAPDELRSKVLQEANKAQFRALNTLFFPYSAVDELYSLCKRRNIRGVTEDFLDCYMEPMTHVNNKLLVS
jgi:type II restriction enzyme